MYIESGTFWAVIVSIVIIYLIKSHYEKKKIKWLTESDQIRSYTLRVCLTDKVLESPLAKDILKKHKKDSLELFGKNSGVDLVFLGGECKWFVNGFFISNMAKHGSSRTLFSEQILGEKGDEHHSPTINFIINERIENGKGIYLSLDLMCYKYTKDRCLPVSEKRIHLGDFPVPSYYDSWDKQNFDRVKQWGWELSNKADDRWSDYDDIFGERCVFFDPNPYVNKTKLVKVDLI